jgi:hypothetical protein
MNESDFGRASELDSGTWKGVRAKPRPCGFGPSDSDSEECSGGNGYMLRQGNIKNIYRWKEKVLVEAAGVEPASEKVTGKATTCLVGPCIRPSPDTFAPRAQEPTKNARR